MKKALLILWCAVSLGWLVVSGSFCKVPEAVRTYRTYYSIVDDIQNNEATSYEKRNYLSYDPYLEEAGMNFAAWLLVGFGLPGLILSGGTWLLRDRKKRAAPKKR